METENEAFINLAKVGGATCCATEEEGVRIEIFMAPSYSVRVR